MLRKFSLRLKGESIMNLFRIVMSVCFLLLITTASMAQQVSVDFDRGVDFSKYKTFAFPNFATPNVEDMYKELNGTKKI